MRSIVRGLSGWVRMKDCDDASVRVVDAAITMVGTTLVALTWVMVRS